MYLEFVIYFNVRIHFVSDDPPTYFRLSWARSAFL